jgi:inhibitor of cysteine peptidase
MMRILACAALALGLAVFAGASSPAAGPQDKGPGQKGKTVTVTEKDKDAKVKLAKGDTLELKLRMQAGTGFTWVVGKGDEDKLKPLGKPTTEKPANLPGGGVTLVYRFEAVVPGMAQLEMWYKRPFEKDKEPAKKFRVTVTIE